MSISPSDRSVFTHREWLQIADTSCLLESNSTTLARSLARWSTGVESPRRDFALRVRVDERAGTLEPAYFRGMEHLVFARYGLNIFLFDLRLKLVDAWISTTVAADEELWASQFLPLMLGVLGANVGVLPLHSACVVKDGRGLLIAGRSTAGKSTLSVALAKAGFALLSDDWTYIRFRTTGLVACGLQVPVKLLPDSARHFPELQSIAPGRTINGEIAFEIPAKKLSGVSTVSDCRPEAIVFLERSEEGPTVLIPTTRSYVHEYVNNSVERLPKELTAAALTRRQLVAALTDLPAWIYRYSGPPQRGATRLAHFVEQLQEAVRP